MSTFNTIHIFGFGDTQIIGTENNGIVKSNTLTSLQTFIDHIKTFKPEDVILTDHHVIHIFNNMSVRYLGKGTEVRTDKTDFIINFSDIDTVILDNLVNEVVTSLSQIIE